MEIKQYSISGRVNKKQTEELLDFIENKWDDLIYNSRNGIKKEDLKKNTDPDKILYLPYNYIVPNKGIFDTMFYWDSYFIIQGLKTEKNRQELIKNITDNCLYEAENYGKVLNANKAKWATRSQLPYLTGMIKEVYEPEKDKKWLQKAFGLAKKEYNDYWLDKYHLTGTGLSRFYDESGNKAIGDYKKPHAYKSRAEASWDMSPRFDDNDIHDLAPIDLNCNLYKYEKDFEKFAEILGNDEETRNWQEKAGKRKKIINDLMWNEKEGLFFDYNFKTGERKKIRSLASYQALFVNLSGDGQAERMKNNLELFETNYGLAACARSYKFSDRQWNWPMIWAPLQHICYKGLKNYGYKKEAEEIGRKFVNLVCKNWKETGKIWEKYNGEKGDLEVPFDRYDNQSGFAWTNAVTEVFIKEIYGINT